MKQNIPNLNTIIKLGIAYAYYTVIFSKPYIKKLDRIMSKLIKKICNLPKSTSNILTHPSHEDFGINTTSFLPDYINCIRQQLIQALNDQCQLDNIYQGLAQTHQHMIWGILVPPKLQYQACVRSPIARTTFLLEQDYEIHKNTNNHSFPIKQT